nr:hypothetical protein [Tanacetum cinerariifolium]
MGFFKTCKTLVELNLEGEYELDVPKDEVLFPSMKKIRLVVYLHIMDEVQSDYSFTVKPLFIVETYIHSVTIYGDQILTNLSAAKVLTLTSSASAFDEVDEVFDKFDEIDEFDKINEVNDQNMQIFANLVKLVTYIQDIRDWRFMNPPLDASACPHFRMKEIVLLNQESVAKEEFSFINFLLKHSSNLEKFTINVQENDHGRREKFLNLFRGANRCQIGFVSSL